MYPIVLGYQKTIWLGHRFEKILLLDHFVVNVFQWNWKLKQLLSCWTDKWCHKVGNISSNLTIVGETLTRSGEKINFQDYQFWNTFLALNEGMIPLLETFNQILATFGKIFTFRMCRNFLEIPNRSWYALSNTSGSVQNCSSLSL